MARQVEDDLYRTFFALCNPRHFVGFLDLLIEIN